MIFWFSWEKNFIKEGNSEKNTKYFPVGTYDDTTIGLCNSRTFGVAYYSQLEGEIGSNEGVTFSVYKWSDEVIPVSNIVGTNLGNDE